MMNSLGLIPARLALFPTLVWIGGRGGGAVLHAWRREENVCEKTFSSAATGALYSRCGSAEGKVEGGGEGMLMRGILAQ
jgi:hypothetical protein